MMATVAKHPRSEAEGGTMMRGTINGVTTFYPGRHYNKEVGPGATKIQKFYFAGTVTIAVRTLTDSADTLTWVLGDHLGSASTTANADGTLNSVIQYTAFGEIRLTQGLTPTKYRYTGQLAQAELGLSFYVSRFYDPALGHFVQADTIIPEPGRSQSWDRFAYVLNNPIRLIDPSGYKWVCIGENNDHCYDDGQGKKSGMATSPLAQEVKKILNNPREYEANKKAPIMLLGNGIAISEEQGVCINWGDIGCSGGTNYSDWLKNEYYPNMSYYIHLDVVNFSVASQNAAFIFSSIGAFFEIIGIPQVHQNATNYLETGSSILSTVLTVGDDLLYTKKTHFEKGWFPLIIDEGSLQSVVGTIVGTNLMLGAEDFLIDGYLVAYNYGFSKGFLSDLGWNGTNILGIVQFGEK